MGREPFRKERLRRFRQNSPDTSSSRTPLVGSQSHPAVNSVHPCHQFRRGEGLCHIIVGAHHQAADLVHFLGAGGEKDNADGRIFPPQFFAHRQTVVFSRHHNVQDGHVKIAVFPVIEFQSLVAGLGLEGLISCPFQVDNHKFPDILFVFRNKYFPHREDTPFLVANAAIYLNP